EALPTIANAVSLGKLFGLPYIPITPWLFTIPLPAKLEVYYSEPILFEGTGAEDDEVVNANVEKVKDRIRRLIELGRKRRRGELVSTEETLLLGHGRTGRPEVTSVMDRELR